MSNKVNVQKGKQGFQPTSRGKIAPTPSHKAKNVHPIAEEPRVVSMNVENASTNLVDKVPNTLCITPAGEEGENDTMLTRVEIVNATPPKIGRGFPI